MWGATIRQSGLWFSEDFELISHIAMNVPNMQFLDSITTPPLKNCIIFDRTHWNHILPFKICIMVSWKTQKQKKSDEPLWRKSLIDFLWFFLMDLQGTSVEIVVARLYLLKRLFVSLKFNFKEDLFSDKISSDQYWPRYVGFVVF